MLAISLLIGFSLAKLPHIYPKEDFFCDGSERCEYRASSSDGLNNLKIKNAAFSDYDNYTIREGGAVYCSDLNLDVDGCTFINCQACDNGGAIYAKVGNAGSQKWEYAYIQISNSNFNECGTMKSNDMGGGGVLFLMGSVENRPITVSNCHFTGFFFPDNINYYDEYNLPDIKKTGGAICMSTPEGKVEKCTFHPNSDSSGLGNCVAFFQPSNTQKCNFEIFDCKFYLDTYLDNAMIYINKVEGDMQINKCTFIQKDGYITSIIDSFTNVKVGQNTRFSKELENHVFPEERKDKYQSDGTVVFEDIIDDQDNTPSEEAPTDDPHTEDPPTQEAPTEDPPTQEAPTENPPTIEGHTENPPTDVPHTEDPPTIDEPTENPSTTDLEPGPDPSDPDYIPIPDCSQKIEYTGGEGKIHYGVLDCKFQDKPERAIYLDGYGLVCRRCSFVNCKESSENSKGGAVYIKMSAKKGGILFIKFDTCHIEHCSAGSGGGFYIHTTRNVCEVFINQCDFIENKATYKSESPEPKGGTGGGGLHLQITQGYITSCNFIDNGGLGCNLLVYYVSAVGAQLIQFQNCTFHHIGNSENRSSVYIFDTSSCSTEDRLVFQSCIFDGILNSDTYHIDGYDKSNSQFIDFNNCSVCTGKENLFQGDIEKSVAVNDFKYSCSDPSPDPDLPTENPHTEEPPTKEPHTEEPPTKEPHTEEPPTKEPHTEEPPTKEPHTEEPPTKEPHTEEPPTKEPHTEEPPTKEPHTEEPPTKEPHTEEPPTKEPHTEEPPTKEPPTKEPHTEEPPTKEPPTKEPPIKEPHTEEQPTPDIVTEQPIDYVCESGKRCSFPPGTLSTTTTITIVKSLFEEISNTDDNIDDGNGGAIYLVNYDVICMNNTFAKCTCSNHGGAMYIEVSLPESAKQINAQISQSNFSKNKAHSGSAIYIKSGHKSRSFSLHGNRFESNEITSSSSSFSTILEESSSPVGGCVFIDGFGGTISNLVFSGNKGKGADLTILLSHDIEDSASTEIHECNFNFVGNKDSSSSVYVIMNVDGPINLQFINCSFNGTLTEDSHFFEVDKSVNKQGKIFLNDVYLCDFTDISAFGENYTDYIDNNSVIYYTCDNLPTWNPDPNPGGNTEEGLSTGAKVAIGIIVPIVIIAVIIVIVIFVFKKNNTENVENPTSELSETANGSSSDFMYSMNSQDNPMYVGNPLSTNIIDEENDPFKHEIEDSSSSNQLV